MQWYYADAGRQVGPLEDAAFEELVRTGVVRDDTPIWREGLADWVPYSTPSRRPATPVQPAPPPPAAAPIPAAAPVEATGFCTQCGGRFPAGQLAMVGNRQMCPACRQAVAPVAHLRPRRRPLPSRQDSAHNAADDFRRRNCRWSGIGRCAVDAERPHRRNQCHRSQCHRNPHRQTLVTKPGAANPAWSMPGPAIPAAQPLTQFATPVAGDYATWANRAIGYIIDQFLVGIAMVHPRRHRVMLVWIHDWTGVARQRGQRRCASVRSQMDLAAHSVASCWS